MQDYSKINTVYKCLLLQITTKWLSYPPKILVPLQNALSALLNHSLNDNCFPPPILEKPTNVLLKVPCYQNQFFPSCIILVKMRVTRFKIRHLCSLSFAWRSGLIRMNSALLWQDRDSIFKCMPTLVLLHTHSTPEKNLQRQPLHQFLVQS